MRPQVHVYFEVFGLYIHALMSFVVYFQGRSKNERKFWDIWGSEETEPVAATAEPEDDIIIDEVV